MFFQGHDLTNCSPYSYILSLKSSQLISKLSWLNFHPGINVICMSRRWQFRRQPVSSLGSSDKHSNWMTELGFKVSWAQRWASQGLMLMLSIQFLRRAIRALMRWGPWASGAGIKRSWEAGLNFLICISEASWLFRYTLWSCLQNVLLLHHSPPSLYAYFFACWDYSFVMLTIGFICIRNKPRAVSVMKQSERS